jgi:FkbM family methyltransferase
MIGLTTIKSLFRRLGVELSWTKNTLLEQRRYALHRFSVDCVVDVGANVGQYATDLRRHGYRGRIISVEPLRDACKALSMAAAADPAWECLNCALGREDGSVDIHRTANSVSSSIMSVTSESTTSCVGTAEVGVEQTRLRTLDSLLSEHGRGARNLFIKIDTQGYELEVLLGALESLKSTVALEVELSFVELYRGQPLFFDVAKHLYEQGFVLVWIERGFQRADHTMLQADGLFVRKVDRAKEPSQ